MERTVMMPKLGMTMEEGTILGWRYKEGDWVEKDEALVEVMTDKVNLEVEAPFTGRLVRILAQEGDALPVGAPMATFSDGKETTPSIGESTELPSNEATPSIGENTELPADAPGGGQQGVPLRTTVASTPAAKREAAVHGIDLQTIIQAGAKPPLNRADVITFVQNGASSSEVSTGNGLSSADSAAAAQPDRSAVRATPLAQKIAQEQRVDLAAVAERKPGAKVTRADIEAHLATQKPEPAQQSASVVSEPEVAESELIPLTPVRRVIGQRMVQSITTTPHIYLDTEIDMTEAERCRQRIGHRLRDKGDPTPSRGVTGERRDSSLAVRSHRYCR